MKAINVRNKSKFPTKAEWKPPCGFRGVTSIVNEEAVVSSLFPRTGVLRCSIQSWSGSQPLLLLHIHVGDKRELYASRHCGCTKNPCVLLLARLSGRVLHAHVLEPVGIKGGGVSENWNDGDRTAWRQLPSATSVVFHSHCLLGLKILVTPLGLLETDWKRLEGPQPQIINRSKFQLNMQ